MSSPSLQYGLMVSVMLCEGQATCQVTEHFFQLDVITELNGILNGNLILQPLLSCDSVLT